MKISLNLDMALLGLDGKTIEPEQKAGPVLAGVLVGQSRGNALKLFDWAVSMHKGEPVELDLADYQVLYDFVEKSESLTVLAKAQMMAVMISAKEKAQTSK